eukprot:3823997-Prymnesium_polylepis.1
MYAPCPRAPCTHRVPAHCAGPHRAMHAPCPRTLCWPTRPHGPHSAQCTEDTLVARVALPRRGDPYV